MKIQISFLVLFLAFTGVFAQTETQTGIDIQVTIDNVRGTDGSVLFSLHTQDTFMKGPGIQNLAVTEIKDGKAVVTFKNVAPGAYAVLCIHDKNNNRRMDFEANGMPAEDFGASNNNMIMGPPNFEDSKFEVGKENMNLTIRF